MSWENLKCPRCGSKSVTPHVEVLPAEGEADRYAPVRDEGFRCGNCGLVESCLNNTDAIQAFRARWNQTTATISHRDLQEQVANHNEEEDRRARAWMWPSEKDDVHDRAWRTRTLSNHLRDERFNLLNYANGEVVFSKVRALPVNEALMHQIIAQPDDVDARRKLAHWLRSVDHPMAPLAATFIDAQLDLAAAYASDPTTNKRESLPEEAFSPRQQDATNLPDQPWWRYPTSSSDYAEALYDSLHVLSELGLVADRQYFRGFVEHVAIRASRFLEIADELFTLAPIRQLTLTYCKGPTHDDRGLLRGLLASPHLRRIRGLKLPARKYGQDKGEATELNRLDDDDIQLLAASQNLVGLRYLDLEDQRQLSPRAFDALASSHQLPQLSAVRCDIFQYGHPGSFSFGSTGTETRILLDRPLLGFTRELETKHGTIRWLHVAEHYGSEAPDVEAVIEHPMSPGLVAAS